MIVEFWQRAYLASIDRPPNLGPLALFWFYGCFGFFRSVAATKTVWAGVPPLIRQRRLSLVALLRDEGTSCAA